METGTFHTVASGETASVSHSRMHASDRFWEGSETRITLFAQNSQEGHGGGGLNRAVLHRGAETRAGGGNGSESRRQKREQEVSTVMDRRYEEKLAWLQKLHIVGECEERRTVQEGLFWFSASLIDYLVPVLF